MVNTHSCDSLAGCAWVLTQIAEDNGQEDQAMQQTQQGDHEVEAEEENLYKLGLSKAQDEDAWEVSHGHSSKHLAGVTARSQGGYKGSGRAQGEPSLSTHRTAHEDSSIFGPLQPCRLGAYSKGPGEVGHKLHRHAHCLQARERTSSNKGEDGAGAGGRGTRKQARQMSRSYTEWGGL